MANLRFVRIIFCLGQSPTQFDAARYASPPTTRVVITMARIILEVCDCIAVD